MNIQPISTNNNTNFQSKLKGKYAVDMLDYAIKNPSGSRRIVDGVKNILEDGKNNIVEMNYTGSKFWDFVFPGAYQISITKNQTGKIEKIKKPWNYAFLGGGIGIQSEFALAEINEGKVDNDNIMLDGMKKRLVKKQQEIFNEYDYNGGREKIINKLHKQYNYLNKKYSDLIREEAIKLKKIVAQETNKA